MARGTRERFDKWAGFLPPSHGITEPHADNDGLPCVVCNRLCGQHDPFQLMACAKEKARLRAGGTDADR